MAVHQNYSFSELYNKYHTITYNSTVKFIILNLIERGREINSHLYKFHHRRIFLPIIDKPKLEERLPGSLYIQDKLKRSKIRQSSKQLRTVQLSLHQQNFFFCFTNILDILFKSCHTRR